MSKRSVKCRSGARKKRFLNAFNEWKNIKQSILNSDDFIMLEKCELVSSKWKLTTKYNLTSKFDYYALRILWPPAMNESRVYKKAGKISEVNFSRLFCSRVPDLEITNSDVTTFIYKSEHRP